MVKSMFGLVMENNTLYSFTRCCRVNAHEGKASDSVLFRTPLSACPSLFLLNFSSTLHQPCSLTDPSSLKSGRRLNTQAKSIGFYPDNVIVRVSGLSLLIKMTMPPREKKIASRFLNNQPGQFSSSRYSLASLGLKGDQNLICE